jgi:thiosulfate dehydrogenase
MPKFVLGFILGVLTIPAIGFLYLHVGHLPVAVSDKPFMLEKEIVRVPLGARIDKEMQSSVPIEVSESNLIAGAKIYRDQCATCHGLQGQPSAFASHMYLQPCDRGADFIRPIRHVLLP